MAISGLILEYFLAKGWTSSAMLILQSVVVPEISYLAINMFIILGALNVAIVSSLKTLLNKFVSIPKGQELTDEQIRTTGLLYFGMTVIPLTISLPFFWCGGNEMRKKKNKETQGWTAEEK